MQIKWIFFDVGSTLVDEEGVNEFRFREALPDLCRAARENGKGEVTFERFSEYMYLGGEQRKAPFYYALREFGVRDRKYDYLTEYERPYPTSRALLETLRKEYKIGIIANQGVGLAERLRTYGLLDLIDAVFGSDDVGLKKPDEAFFRYALEQVGCAPGEAVMVGDRVDNDIAPAHRVGMNTLHLQFGYFKDMKPENEDEIADAVAGTHAEIPDKIREIGEGKRERN